MHVLIIPSWYPNSAEDIGGSFFREQAVALAGRIDQVGVIFPELKSIKALYRFRKQKHGLSYINDSNVHTYRWHSYNWTPRIPYGIYHQWLLHGEKLLEEYIQRHGKPDVIHAHCLLYAGALAIYLKRIYGIPVVLTEHSSGYSRNLHSEFESKLAKKTTTDCDRLLAVSKALAQKMKNIAPNSALRWTSIPNIVDKAFLNFDISNKKKKFIFANVGLLEKNKRQDILINAFEVAFSKDSHVFLEIAGQGPEGKNLSQLISKLKLENRVRLRGEVQRSEMPSFLSQAGAFVLSSELETFGVVLVEALAMGIPVVSTKSGGPNDFITREDGLLTPVNDIDSLAAAMKEIHNNINKYDPKKIRSNCMERFGEEAVCGKLVEIYSGLLGS